MSQKGLTEQSDLEQLLAWMDGELPPDQAERVARLVEQNDDWRASFEQFQAVDRAAEMLAGTVSPPRDLPDRIIHAVYRRSRVMSVVRIAVPVAAAACIVVALWIGAVFSHRPVKQTPTAFTKNSLHAIVKIEKRIDTILRDVKPEDRFIVQNLTLFKEYPRIVEYRKVAELVDADTLSALESMEGNGRM